MKIINRKVDTLPALWRRPLRQNLKGARNPNQPYQLGIRYYKILEQFVHSNGLPSLRKTVLLQLHSMTALGYGRLIDYKERFYGILAGAEVMENFFLRAPQGALCWIEFNTTDCALSNETSHIAVSRSLAALVNLRVIKRLIVENGEKWYAIDYQHILNSTNYQISK